MVKSTGLFFRNLIKYFFYIAVFAQIVSGTVYLVCNFTDFVVYPETEEMVHVARGLLFDEYTGVLYPLFIRLCLIIQSFLGIGYYLVVHTVQLILAVLGVIYFVKNFYTGKKLWIATAYIISFPMFLQTVLMVSPYFFKTFFCLIMAGAMVRLYKGNGRIREWLFFFGAYLLSALNVTDDLYLWIGPIAVFCVAYIVRYRKCVGWKKGLCLMLVVGLVFSSGIFLLNATVEPGVRGRMQRTVSSVLFQRTLWPDLIVKYNFMPREIRNYITHQAAIESDSCAEKIIYAIGSNVDREVGFEKANELYMESFVNQMAYNKRAIFETVFGDFTGYLLTPYSTVKYLSGQEGSAFSTLYGIMSAGKGKATYNYFCISLVSLFVLTFGALLRALKEKMLANKTYMKRLVYWAALLGYQALWYSICNVQGVDYRYGLFHIVVFSVFVFWGQMFFREKDEDNTDNKKIHFSMPFKKKVLFIGTIGLGICVLLLGVFGVKNCNNSGNQLAEKKIVCFGDSIWGMVTDETGIAKNVEKMTGAKVLNYALSGTTATETIGTLAEKEGSAYSLMQIVKALEEGKDLRFINPEELEDADYLIIAYGLNDYFQGVLAKTNKDKDIYTYEGALEYAVEYFKENYPNLQIVIIGQTYCQFYSYGIVETDSDTKSFGGGIGMDYVQSAERVADKYDAIFINQYESLPINKWNGTKYLEDATHLNKLGRRMYAEVVSEYLVKDYKERNAQ